MTHLKRCEEEYWLRYVSTRPLDEISQSVNVTASYSGNREMTDALLALYLMGKKHAGSSIVEDFLTAGDPLPKVGNYWIHLNSKDEPKCILKTVRIAINKFKDVPEEIAIAEGEGDLSLEYWRRVHAKHYGPHLTAWGIASIDEATVITEFFELVFR